MTAFPILFVCESPLSFHPRIKPLWRTNAVVNINTQMVLFASFRNVTIIVGVLLAGGVFVIISCYLYKYHPKLCNACHPWLMLFEACDKPRNDVNYTGSSQRPRCDSCKGDCCYPGCVCDLVCCLGRGSQGDDSDCKPGCECNDCGGDCGDCNCGNCDCGSCDCGDCVIMW